MSRQWTREECRNLFLDYLWGAVDEWEKIYHDRDPDCTVRRAIAGAVFSTLAMIDGCAGHELPGFAVVPTPHPDSRSYRKDMGENWWPETPEELVHSLNYDVELHDEFYKRPAASHGLRGRPTRADVSWGKRSSQFDLSDDTFSRRSRVHDWRNHVAEEVEAQWQHLTSRERLLVAVMANEPAENEEWD